MWETSKDAKRIIIEDMPVAGICEVYKTTSSIVPVSDM
jgi:hypothetical protein